MEDLKQALESLFAKIQSCGNAGVNGERVAELKQLALTAEEELKKLDQE